MKKSCFTFYNSLMDAFSTLQMPLSSKATLICLCFRLMSRWSTGAGGQGAEREGNREGREHRGQGAERAGGREGRKQRGQGPSNKKILPCMYLECYFFLC